jgi:hypothetical protein
MKHHGALIAALALLGCASCTDEGIVGSRSSLQCVSDMDCAGSSDGPLCDLESNACRSCDAGDTCPAPECEPPDELDDLLEDDDCDLDEGDASLDDDDDEPNP